MPRRTSGQKKSWAPLSPVISESRHAAAAKISAPAVMSSRGSTFRVSRPVIAIERAVVIAPGSSTRPVCSAVIRRLFCRNTGSVKDIA